MKRIIKVKGRTGRFDVPSFLWTENETLTVQFDVVESVQGKFIAVAMCGTQKKTVTLDESKEIEITPEFIKDGGFQPVSFLLEYRTLNDDRLIVSNDPKKGGYFIEPLLIQRVDENTTAIAWLQKVENDMQALSARIARTEERLAKFEDNGVPLIFEDKDENE